MAAANQIAIRRASVFCTDSIAMEYTQLMEVPAAALLVISDNSAAGIPLVGRSEEDQKAYDYARKTLLIDLIDKITSK